jgi:hypothetical protein
MKHYLGVVMILAALYLFFSVGAAELHAQRMQAQRVAVELELAKEKLAVVRLTLRLGAAERIARLRALGVSGFVLPVKEL